MEQACIVQLLIAPQSLTRCYTRLSAYTYGQGRDATRGFQHTHTALGRMCPWACELHIRPLHKLSVGAQCTGLRSFKNDIYTYTHIHTHTHTHKHTNIQHTPHHTHTHATQDVTDLSTDEFRNAPFFSLFFSPFQESWRQKGSHSVKFSDTIALPAWILSER